MVLLISGILLCFFLILTGWDLFGELAVWTARIGIGRWTKREQWKRAVRQRAGVWLKRMPVVPKTDNDRYRLLDFLKSKRYSARIQSWQTAGLLMGMDTKDIRFYDALHPDRSWDQTGVDGALLAYVLKKAGLLSEHQQEQICTTLQIDRSSGTLFYRESLPFIRYVDTIGLACPFLYACGKEDLADRQVAEFDPYLLDGVFPPHACRLDRQLPLGAYDWSRGTGWYILGLVESGRNEDRILRLAYRMLTLQREDGSFGCRLFDPSSRKESSGTALAGILFVRAYELNADKRFLKAATQAERALMRMTRRNGAVDFAQGDTQGIGLYSRRFDILPFAQGMTLYLSKSLDKHGMVEL